MNHRREERSFAPSDPPSYEGRIAASAAAEPSRKAERGIGDTRLRKAIQRALSSCSHTNG
jgi:hypothetical protein